MKRLHLAGCTQGTVEQQNRLAVVHSGALTQEVLWSVVHQWLYCWVLSLSSLAEGVAASDECMF